MINLLSKFPFPTFHQLHILLPTGQLVCEQIESALILCQTALMVQNKYANNWVALKLHSIRHRSHIEENGQAMGNISAPDFAVYIDAEVQDCSNFNALAIKS